MLTVTCEWMEMGHFQALPDVVAVAANRLVAIVRVESDGSVVVRDLANGDLSAISASELSAPASLAEPPSTARSVAQATEAQWELARRREVFIARLAHSSNPSTWDAKPAAQPRVHDSHRRCRNEYSGTIERT